MDSLLERMRDDLERITHGEPDRLERFGFKVHSQSDEDGILQEIFRRIGLTNKVFVEFGAEVGLECNSLYLLEQSWTGFWMEGNPDYKGAILHHHAERLASGQLKFESVFVYPDNINELISGAGISGEIDMLSIDIDSNDYHVWKAINVISPRVVVAEHNHSYAPHQEYIMPYNRDYFWGGSAATYGASLLSNTKLAAELGYTLVSCGLYSANGFFVRNDLVQDRFGGPFTADRLWNPLNYEMVLAYPVGPTPLAERLARLA